MRSFRQLESSCVVAFWLLMGTTSTLASDGSEVSHVAGGSNGVILVAPTAVQFGDPFVLSWTSTGTTGATPCTPSGGGPTTWASQGPLEANGSRVVTAPFLPGSFVFSITCDINGNPVTDSELISFVSGGGVGSMMSIDGSCSFALATQGSALVWDPLSGHVTATSANGFSCPPSATGGGKAVTEAMAGPAPTLSIDDSCSLQLDEAGAAIAVSTASGHVGVHSQSGLSCGTKSVASRVAKAGDLRLGLNEATSIALAPAPIGLALPTAAINRRLSLELGQPVLCTSFAATTTDVAVNLIDPQGAMPYPALRGFGAIDYRVNDAENRGLIALSTQGGPAGEDALACCILDPADNAACLQGGRIEASTGSQLFADDFESPVPIAGPDLVVSVQAPASIEAGEQLTYTVTIANQGLAPANGARLREYFPLTASLPPALSAGSWTCAAAGAGSACADASGNGVIGSLAEQSINLASGGSVVYTITRTVLANPLPAPGSLLRLHAAAFAQPADQEMPLGNNQGDAIVTIATPALGQQSK